MPHRNRNGGQYWKGENGLYCVGFGKNGLFGIAEEAKAVVADITAAFTHNNNSNN